MPEEALDRSRWAREIHDGPLQNVAALRVLLAGIGNRGEHVGDREALLSEGTRLADATVAQLRRLIADIDPAAE